MKTTTDWRPYMVAALAGAYLLALRAVAPPQRDHDAHQEPPRAPRASAAPPARVSWWQDLPAAARPPLALPAGWQIVGDPTTRARQPAAPRSRPRRIRTRSS